MGQWSLHSGRRVLLVTLLAFSLPSAAEAQQRSSLRSLTLHYAPGGQSAPGYERATVNVDYRFIRCYGDVHVLMALRPATTSASSRYWYEGEVWESGDVPVRQPSSVDVQLRVLTASGANVLSFRLAALHAEEGPGCLGQTRLLAPLNRYLPEDRSEQDITTFLNSLILTASPMSDRLTNPVVANRLRQQLDRARADSLEAIRVAQQRADSIAQVRADSIARDQQQRQAQQDSVARQMVQDHTDLVARQDSLRRDVSDRVAEMARQDSLRRERLDAQTPFLERVERARLTWNYAEQAFEDGDWEAARRGYILLINGAQYDPEVFGAYRNDAQARLDVIENVDRVRQMGLVTGIWGGGMGLSAQQSYFAGEWGVVGFNITRHFESLGHSIFGIVHIGIADEDDIVERTRYALTFGSTLPLLRFSTSNRTQFYGFHSGYTRYTTEHRTLNFLMVGFGNYSAWGDMIRLDATFVNGRPQWGVAASFNFDIF